MAGARCIARLIREIVDTHSDDAAVMKDGCGPQSRQRNGQLAAVRVITDPRDRRKRGSVDRKAKRGKIKSVRIVDLDDRLSQAGFGRRPRAGRRGIGNERRRPVDFKEIVIGGSPQTARLAGAHMEVIAAVPVPRRKPD